MGHRYGNILETIGNTPVVRINRLGPDGIELYVKLEASNPMGSVKDRLALGVIEDAEQRGLLVPGQTVVEATSGNTGIGLAMVCAQRGYPLVVVMAENFSVERRKILRFLGAKVVLTPAAEKGTGMLRKAEELAEAHDWFLCRQFSNEANADVHSRTTATEILRDFDDVNLDYWVTGFGTGGTLKGVARVLKDKSPNTKVVVCEPDNSSILASQIPQPRSTDGTPSESHPSFRTHVVQGWSPDFIPDLAEDVLAEGWVDDFVAVTGGRALELSQALAAEEGIFTGISGGATFAGALAVAESAPEGSTVLCMLPDTGERYLTTPLFFDISEDMTAAEIEISRSTPSYRFDASCSTKPKPDPATSTVITPEAVSFVDEATHDADHPVVLFAFEWCEFSWSIRKMFDRAGIPFRSIDLDSADFQKEDWGGQVRAALEERFHTRTIPQVFVGGTHVGGCTETFDAFKDGRFHGMLSDCGVAPSGDLDFDPYVLLPGWVQPR